MTHQDVTGQLRVEELRLVRLAVDFGHGVLAVLLCIRRHIAVPRYALQARFELLFTPGFERLGHLQLDVLGYAAGDHELPEEVERAAELYAFSSRYLPYQSFRLLVRSQL